MIKNTLRFPKLLALLVLWALFSTCNIENRIITQCHLCCVLLAGCDTGYCIYKIHLIIFNKASSTLFTQNIIFVVCYISNITKYIIFLCVTCFFFTQDFISSFLLLCAFLTINIYFLFWYIVVIASIINVVQSVTLRSISSI